MRPLRFLPILALLLCACRHEPIAPYGPLPSESQIEWQKMETNMFCHFGPNTFSGLEWGEGSESEDLFNPSALDCRQWASTALQAGFKGIIITAKHHDGFCLWPNPVSRHTVAQSRWKDGHGDVLKELSDACSEVGLAFGVYISPWDRHDPSYGSEAYNQVYVKTLESVHSGQYGRIFEQWFDGACGEGPNGKRQVYDWPLFHATVRRHSPNAVMFSDVGPGCRWVGNERGQASRTNWSTLDTTGFAPGKDAPSSEVLGHGNQGGEAWIPAETDVSIRPGWFWRESETAQVKSVAELMNIYYNSVGRNSLLLLNVPPDSRGLLDPVDSLTLVRFAEARERVFSNDLSEGASVKDDGHVRGYRASNMLDGDFETYWAAKDKVSSFVVTLPGPRSFNRVQLQEYIALGQRVATFSISARDDSGEWRELASETTIGYKRIILTDTVTTDAVRVIISDSLAPAVISSFALYFDSEDYL